MVNDCVDSPRLWRSPRSAHGQLMRPQMPAPSVSQAPSAEHVVPLEPAHHQSTILNVGHGGGVFYGTLMQQASFSGPMIYGQAYPLPYHPHAPADPNELGYAYGCCGPLSPPWEYGAGKMAMPMLPAPFPQAAVPAPAFIAGHAMMPSQWPQQQLSLQGPSHGLRSANIRTATAVQARPDAGALPERFKPKLAAFCNVWLPSLSFSILDVLGGFSI